MYTRQGDKGKTSLFGGRRTAKDSPLVEAYGTIDELNCIIGVAVAEAGDNETLSSLKRLQSFLFVAGSDCASEFTHSKGVPRITSSDTAALEAMTDELLSRLPTLRNFILPGGTRLAAQLQLARAVCRRAERRLVSASKKGRLNPELLPFFNRLSTYLFDLSRSVNAGEGKKEDVWSKSV